MSSPDRPSSHQAAGGRPPSGDGAAVRRGILLILSSPSGAGKTTLARRLLDEFDEVEFSVSYTTRAPRGNEQSGVDYVFVARDEFQRMIDAGEFAEWAQVHGNRYGTARRTVERALATGRDVLFDIDWQGGAMLAERWPGDALKVFVLPPDLATLEARLRSRGTDSAEVIERRLAKAASEIVHCHEYHYAIVNDRLDDAYRALRAVYLVRRGRSGAADSEVAAVRAVAAAHEIAAGATRTERIVAEARRRLQPEL